MATNRLSPSRMSLCSQERTGGEDRGRVDRGRESWEGEGGGGDDGEQGSATVGLEQMEPIIRV